MVAALGGGREASVQARTAGHGTAGESCRARSNAPRHGRERLSRCTRGRGDAEKNPPARRGGTDQRFQHGPPTPGSRA